MAAKNLKQKSDKRTSSGVSRQSRNSVNGEFVTAKGANAKAKSAVKKAPPRKDSVTANDRYEMRIDSTRRANWERAKALAGFSTLKDYLTHLADQDAEKIIEKHDTMILKNSVFDMFIETCEASSKPNDKLLAAAKQAKELGF